LTRIDESVEIELDMAWRTLTIFQESEVLGLSDRELTKRLKQGIVDLTQLLGTSNGVSPTQTLGFLLAATGPEAKRKLQASGYESEKLDDMSDLQASLVLAGRELKMQGDQLLKASKVRGSRGLKLGEKTSEDFQRWLDENRASAAGIVAGLLYPAVSQVHRAELRARMVRSRLLAAEALRLFGKSHHGQLPTSLDEMVDTPAPLDPFSDKHFGYRIEKSGAGQIVTLTCDTPNGFDSVKELKILFPNSN
jgi:hypothetical protein